SSSGRRLAILAAGTSMLVAILALARISPWIADRAGLGLAILSLLTGVACALSLPGRWRSALAGVLELDATGDIREPRAAADAALVLLHGCCCWESWPLSAAGRRPAADSSWPLPTRAATWPGWR